MKDSSNQAGHLLRVSILHLIKDFLIEEGFDRELITIENDHTLCYDWWGLACFSNTDGLAILPFRTNNEVALDPARPDFFDELRSHLDFPTPDQPFGFVWAKRGTAFNPNKVAKES